MEVHEEWKCIRSVLQGNLNGFERLILAHQERSMIIAQSMVKNEDDAKDVLQESYIQAYNYLHTFDHNARFGTWFYRIVVNQSLKWIRKNKRKGELIADISDEEDAHSFNLGLEKLVYSERKKRIQQVFDKMKPKEALMLNMFYLLEFSVQEIHQSTGFSISNIKVLLHRSRRSFRNLSKEDWKN